MAFLRWLSIPLLVLACLAGLVYWSFPVGLSPGRSLGIILGWSGCSLLLVSLILMLRESTLARTLGGLERMYRWHHRTGIAAYLSLLAHPLALAADAWSESPALAWQTLSPFDQGWPIWTGWLSLALMMAGLAAAFEQRIPYRTWRWLHFGLGVAVLLGLLHLALLGIDEPVVPLMGFAGLMLAWRIVRVDWGLAARPYVVQSVNPVADGMIEITLAPLAEPIAVTAGQFVLVAFFEGPKFRGCGEFHPFTVSSAGPGQSLRVGVKALGDCTRHIQSVEPGVMVRVQGAFGTFLANRPATPQLWVAGGIGLTPFLALLRSQPITQPTTLLYLYRGESDAAFLHELADMAESNPQLTIRPMATGSEPPEFDRLLPEAPQLAGYACYLCGPPGMITALKRSLRERGIPAGRIHFENFGFR